ncbi:putative claudin-25 [Dissostichus eleginoides]|uniref:Claudin n=1 Tax=Dissostichus eleginoides TaxID=100907 RepID=A0AAD9C7X2_DISEL|nr:putative claudin-25 [Dissostichus eleginoides]
MDSCALELLAMLLFVAAWLCVLASTLLPQWLTMSTALLPVESYELGLWETCVVQDVGGMECRAYDSLLGLSRDLKLSLSYMAHLAVMHFFDDKVPDVVPRWEFGDALFIGWAGGFLLVVAGLLLVSACWCSPGGETEPALQRRYQVMCTDVSFKKRSEYV